MSITLVERAASYADRVAVVDTAGEFTYADLLDASERVACTLLAGRGDLGEARVAFMVGPGFDHVAVLWGIWRAGGIAVPLSPAHPLPEIEHMLDDTGAEAVVADMASELRLKPLAAARDAWLVRATDAIEGRQSFSAPCPPPPALESRALILYTSGTTSRPNGLVLTPGNLPA